MSGTKAENEKDPLQRLHLVVLFCIATVERLHYPAFLSTCSEVSHNQSCHCKRFRDEGEWAGEREGGEEDECSVTKKDSLGFVFPFISIHHSTTTPAQKERLCSLFSALIHLLIPLYSTAYVS